MAKGQGVVYIKYVDNNISSGMGQRHNNQKILGE